MPFVGLDAGSFISISALAINVYAAYKDTPDDHRNISEEVAALQILIDKAAKHFKGAAISSDDCHDGRRILKGCYTVLQDLHSLIKKHKRLASSNERLVLTGVPLGREDITALQGRLISSTVLLNGFVRRFVVPDILLPWSPICCWA